MPILEQAVFRAARGNAGVAVDGGGEKGSTLYTLRLDHLSEVS